MAHGPRRFAGRALLVAWAIGSPASLLPAPPAPEVADAGSHLSLDWGDLVDPDLAGYRVYAGPAPYGPWTPLNADRLLVAAGSTWAWATGADLGTAWSETGYDDGGWAAGPAILGYGEGDEATVLPFGPDPSHKYRTAYFRRKFAAPDPALFGGLTLELKRDDGAVVYLNGVEACRSNMPPSPAVIDSSTYASTPLGDPDENQFVTIPLPANLLVPGENLIAVEVHQATDASSDLIFDLELIATARLLPESACDDWEAPAGENRWYVVAGVDLDGDEGERSAVACGAAGPPGVPGGPGLTDGTGGVRAAWSAVGDCDAAGYRIYRRPTAGGGPVLLNGSLATATEYLDATAIGGTEYAYSVTAVDAAGHEGLPSAEAVILHSESTAPVISGLAVTDVTGTGARVTWTTDEPADSTVDYGLTDAYGSTIAEGSLVTAHSVVLDGLSPGVRYHARATSRDATGNPSSSEDVAFDTTPVTALVLRGDDAPGPGEAFAVHLEVTSSLNGIFAVGARLLYDEARVEPAGVERGSGVPETWTFAWSAASGGRVDVVIIDPSSGSAAVSAPSALEAVRLRFRRTGTACDPASFSFSDEAPAPGPEEDAFPRTRFVRFADGGPDLVSAATGQAGTAGVTDHAFLRGNVNDRSSHRLDISDVVDLARILFQGATAVPCQAAMDVNDDGKLNVLDVVTLLYGIIDPGLVRIPAPSSAVPQAVAPDGGEIPSRLGCASGETCP